MSDAVDVQSYKAHQAREAAFEQWWRLSYQNRTLPRTIHGIAREAYFAAWGGAGALAARQDGALAELKRLHAKHGEQVTADVIARLEQSSPK